MKDFKFSGDNVEFYDSAFKGYGAYIVLWFVTISFIEELTILTIIWFFVYLFLTLKGIYNSIKSHRDNDDRLFNKSFNEVFFNFIGCVLVVLGYFLIFVVIP